MQVRHRAPDVVAFAGPIVIVGGGAVDGALLKELHGRGLRLVAADGGADRIVAAGLRPELIVGDFDSLTDPFGWLGKTRLMRIGEQDSVDFEKAIYATQAPLTVAIGMTGNRFDHTLAALDVLARYARLRQIVLVAESDIAIAVSGAFSFAVEARDRVSVHPLGTVTFEKSEGLSYPLDGITLSPGVRTGTSNRALTGPFSLLPESDEPYLVIVDRGYLPALIDRAVS